MSTLKHFTLILTLIVLTACSAAPTVPPIPTIPATPTSPLAANRQKWEAKHISHYRFQLSVSCFCVFRDKMPLTVEIKDGQLVSMLDNQGQPVTELLDTLETYDSIEKLFGILDSAFKDGADEVTVDYNPDYGYPQTINIDYSKQAADDEISFEISEFEILK